MARESFSTENYFSECYLRHQEIKSFKECDEKEHVPDKEFLENFPQYITEHVPDKESLENFSQHITEKKSFLAELASESTSENPQYFIYKNLDRNI